MRSVGVVESSKGLRTYPEGGTMVITKDGKMKKNPTSKKTNTSATQAMILEQ